MKRKKTRRKISDEARWKMCIAQQNRCKIARAKKAIQAIPKARPTNESWLFSLITKPFIAFDRWVNS